MKQNHQNYLEILTSRFYFCIVTVVTISQRRFTIPTSPSISISILIFWNFHIRNTMCIGYICFDYRLTNWKKYPYVLKLLVKILEFSGWRMETLQLILHAELVQICPHIAKNQWKHLRKDILNKFKQNCSVHSRKKASSMFLAPPRKLLLQFLWNFCCFNSGKLFLRNCFR